MPMSFNTIMLLFTAAFVLIGALLGLVRGVRKALLRLVLVGAAAAGTWIIEGKLVAAVSSFKIGGQTLEQLLASKLPQEIAAAASSIMPMLEIVIAIVGFALIFLSFLFVSWIIYLILQIFVPKGFFKMRWAGALCGALQGALVAFFVCVPLCGVAVETQKLANAEFKGEKLVPAAFIEMIQHDAAVQPTKFYLDAGAPLFDHLSSTVDENGNKITLDSQIEMLLSAIQLADQVQKLTEIDFSQGLNINNVAEFSAMLKTLDTIKGDMSEETVEQVTQMINTVAADFNLPVDISNVDFKEVDFANESVIVEAVYQYQETGDVEDVPALVESVSESKLILPVLKDSDASLSLTDEQKTEVQDAINNLETVDEETKNALEIMFGLRAPAQDPDQGEQNPDQGEQIPDQGEQTPEGGAEQEPLVPEN